MSRKLFVKTLDDPLNSSDKSIKLNPDVCSLVRFDIFRKYGEGEVRLDVYLIGEESTGTDNPESQDFVFAVERVAIEPFVVGGPATGRFGAEYLDSLSHWQHAHDTQSSVAVKPSHVVDILQGILQPTIRMVDRFISGARLYCLHPVNEILREWETVESVLIDILGLPFSGKGKLQTSQALCIGGRLGTLPNRYCFPNQSIECGTELVRELSKFEGELIGLEFEDGLRTKVDSECPPPGMFIVTNDGSMSFSLKEGSPFSLKGIPVQSRSLEPIPTVFEVFSHPANSRTFAASQTKIKEWFSKKYVE